MAITALFAAAASSTGGHLGLPLRRLTEFTTVTLQAAVGDYCSNPTNAESTYGPIASWDVSLVDDMSHLFGARWVGYDVYYYCSTISTFNGDVSAWDVGNVLTTKEMFRDAEAFNQDLSVWDVGSVTSMFRIFYMAKAFNGDVSEWDVGNVVDMFGTFHGALAFNREVAAWNVGKVGGMMQMFYYATVFNQDISPWDISSVTTTQMMFDTTQQFNVILCWDLAGVSTTAGMFTSSSGSVSTSDPPEDKCSCVAGTYYDGSICTLCLAGTYSVGKTETCLSCPSGKSSGAGASWCSTSSIPTPVPSTHSPSPEPTNLPTPEPTPLPTYHPTPEPTLVPTLQPKPVPTHQPTPAPVPLPTAVPIPAPSGAPTPPPSPAPTVTCVAGQFFDGLVCKDCGAGTFSNTSLPVVLPPWPKTCTTCPVGQYSTAIAASSCTECPEGKLSASDRTYCKVVAIK